MRRPVGLHALLLILSAAVAAAQENPPEVCPAIDVPAPAAARVRVFVDSATGRRREPTADELRRLAEERLATKRAAPPPVFEVITYSDGMTSVDLGDAFLFDVRIARQPDGSTRLECLPHSESAGRSREK